MGFQDLLEEIYGTPSSQRINLSFNLEEDDEQSPLSVEHLSPSQPSIPKTLGWNKARKEKQMAKERGAKAIGDKIVSALWTLAEQTAKVEEDKRKRYEQMDQQRQEEMDERNMARNTADMTPNSKEFFEGKKRAIRERHRSRELSVWSRGWHLGYLLPNEWKHDASSGIDVWSPQECR